MLVKRMIFSILKDVTTLENKPRFTSLIITNYGRKGATRWVTLKQLLHLKNRKKNDDFQPFYLCSSKFCKYIINQYFIIYHSNFFPELL